MATRALDLRPFSTSWLEGTRRRRLTVLAILAITLSLLFARLVLLVDIGAPAGLITVAAVIAVCIRPRYGVYMLFALVLFFDGVWVDPIMSPARYINSSLQTTFRLSGAILIPLEMLILLTSTVWLAQAAMSRKLQFQGGFFGRPVLLFAVMLIFGAVRGFMAGATINYIFWESRFLFGMVLTYVLTTNTIRTRAHVRNLITLVVVCVGLSGLDGVWRKYALINNGLLGNVQEYWYSHDGVVIWGLLMVLVFAQQVLGGGSRWQRMLGPLLALATAFSLLVSERRAGLVAVMIALALCTFALVTIKRRAFWLISVPAIIVVAIYLPLFWNNTGTLGQPARALRSVSSPDQRDASSNAWRDLEAVNVRATIASDPLLGIGFGRPFLQVVKVPDISFFEFWNYESHHDILWVWMKTGALGFIAFMILMLGTIARSIWLARTAPHLEMRAFGMMAAAAVVMSMVYCYVDLGLTEIRIPLMLGVVIGTIGVLDRVRD